jgi:transcriptional regulator with XRE-family HTH domain
MENIRLRIGKRIKELRKKRGLTQEKLSEVADIDYKYIQRLEGKNPPALKVDTVERLAKALKVSPAELLKS